MSNIILNASEKIAFNLINNKLFNLELDPRGIVVTEMVRIFVMEYLKSILPLPLPENLFFRAGGVALGVAASYTIISIATQKLTGKTIPQQLNSA